MSAGLSPEVRAALDALADALEVERLRKDERLSQLDALTAADFPPCPNWCVPPKGGDHDDIVMDVDGTFLHSHNGPTFGHVSVDGGTTLGGELRDFGISLDLPPGLDLLDAAAARELAAGLNAAADWLEARP